MSEIPKSKKLTTGWPDEISYDKKDPNVDKYYEQHPNGATSDKKSFFFEKRSLNIFIHAMAIGKYHDVRIPLSKKSNSLPTSSLQESEIWKMMAVALIEPGQNLKTILENPKELVKICEEYANGGIKYLMDLDQPPIKRPEAYGLFEDEFEKLLNEND